MIVKKFTMYVVDLEEIGNVGETVETMLEHGDNLSDCYSITLFDEEEKEMDFDDYDDSVFNKQIPIKEDVEEAFNKLT